MIRRKFMSALAAIPFVGSVVSSAKSDDKQECFSEGYNQVLTDATHEAWSLGHDYLGTEHILLGLTKNKGIVGSILKDIGADYESVYVETKKLTTPGPKTHGQLPNSPRAEQLLSLAFDIARRMGCEVVTPEHILLALFEVKEGISYQVLINVDAVKFSIFKSLGVS